MLYIHGQVVSGSASELHRELGDSRTRNQGHEL